MNSLALFFTLKESAILQISKIYSFTLSDLRVQVHSVQQQESCYDCGPFSIATAIEVCFGNNPELATFDQPKMRAHLIECFEERKLSLLVLQDTFMSLNCFVCVICLKSMML